MHLPLAFINCSNILITLCCSLRERQRESSRKQLFSASLQQSTWDKKVCKINSQWHTLKNSNLLKCSLQRRGCIVGVWEGAPKAISQGSQAQVQRQGFGRIEKGTDCGKEERWPEIPDEWQETHQSTHLHSSKLGNNWWLQSVSQWNLGQLN